MVKIGVALCCLIWMWFVCRRRIQRRQRRRGSTWHKKNPRRWRRIQRPRGRRRTWKKRRTKKSPRWCQITFPCVSDWTVLFAGCSLCKTTGCEEVSCPCGCQQRIPGCKKDHPCTKCGKCVFAVFCFATQDQRIPTRGVCRSCDTGKRRQKKGAGVVRTEAKRR